MRREAALFAALVAAGAPAFAQTIYKCTTAQGTVTYQETPCTAPGSQRRVDTSHGALADADPDPAAREMLEREALRGDPLARGFAEEARRRAQSERERRLEREERLRRERATRESREPEEPPAWNPPWGFPAKPGLARPKTP